LNILMLLHTPYETKSSVDPRVRKEMEALEKNHSLKLMILPCPFTRSEISELKTLFWLPLLLKEIIRNKIDVVHIHNLPLALPGIIASKLTRKKAVLDLHEPWPLHLKSRELFKENSFHYVFWRCLEVLSVLLASRVIVVCEEAAERFKKTCTIVSNYSDWKPNGSHRSRDYFTIGYCGGMQRHRGINHLIEAFASFQTRFPDTRLILVGDGPERKNLERLVTNLLLTDKVKFFGGLHPDKAKAAMNSCDCCVIPHIKSDFTDHTMPHKLFEYMSLGKPVITTNCGPLRRVVQETRCGLVCETVEDMADAMEIMMHPNIFGLNALKAAKHKYNWKNEARKLIKLYASL